MTVKVERQQKQVEVPLDTPIVVGADMRDVLVFRKMTAGDLRIFDNNKGNADAMLQLCTKLSVPEMLPGQADKISLEDWGNVQEVLSSFLKAAVMPKSEPATS